MCGYFILEGECLRSRSELLADDINKLLSSRGPDDIGIFVQESIAVKHYRLITRGNAEVGRQPINSDRYLFLFNGNISNTSELVSKYRLGLASCDTNIIFELYEKIGDRMFKELNGFFSIAIYDKHVKVWTLARDRYGIKPLYYYHGNRGIAACSRSDVLSLLCYLKPDPGNTFSFLKYGCALGSKTIYNEIYSVDPGSYLKLSIGKPPIHTSYWSLHDALLRTGTEQFEQTRFNSLLDRAIIRATDTCRELGILFSGGLDSTSIALGYSQLASSCKASIYNLGKLDDEVIAAASKEMLPNSILVREEYDPTLEASQQSLDLPFDDTSYVSSSQIYSLVRQKSQVCIVGDGADEIFGGYQCFNNLPVYSLLSPLARRLSGLKEVRPLSRLYSRDSIKKLSLHEAELFDSLVSNAYKDWELAPFLTKKGFDRLQANRIRLNGLEDLTLMNKLRYIMISQKLCNQMLYKVDRSSMHNGVEARPVYLDNDLVEYAILALPSSASNNKSWIREYIRSKISSKHKVTASLLHRAKVGFGFPVSYIKQPTVGEITKVLDFFEGYLVKDKFLAQERFSKRQSTIIKSIASHIG